MRKKETETSRDSSSLHQLRQKLKVLALQSEKKIAKLRTLMEIGNALNSTSDLDRIFEMIVESTARVLGAELSSLMILERGCLRVKAARGISRRLMQQINIRPGEGIAGWVAESAQPFLIDDITREERFAGGRGGRKYKSNSLISVPIVHKGNLLGVINCTNKTSGDVFTQTELEFMQILASQAAVAIANARMMDWVQHLAERDGLTDLYNHRYFIERIAAEIERVDRYRESALSLVMIDIDRFKKVNDRYGHQAGDKVLQALARKMFEATRKVDIICRYGGEEFMMILPEVRSEGAWQCVERLRKKVAEMVVIHNDRSISFTISAGICEYPLLCKNSDMLISCVDNALYEAKRLGRNRVCIFQGN